MADNCIIRLCECITGLKIRIIGKIRETTSNITQQQSVVLIVILLTTFIVVDVIYIVRGFRGDSKSSIEVEHIKQVDTELLKPIQYDTIPEYRHGQ
jgi:hypothetical protein